MSNSNFLLSFLMASLFFCGGETFGQVLRSQSMPDTGTLLEQNIPYRFWPLKYRIRYSPKEKYIGGIKFIRSSYSPDVYEHEDTLKKILSIESAPGIVVCYDLSQPYTDPRHINLYDSLGHLISQIDIRKSSPYSNSIFPIIGRGPINREVYRDIDRQGYDEAIPLPECTAIQLLNEVMLSPCGDYFTIKYVIFNINNSQMVVVGGEETIVAYDKRGRELARKTLPGLVHASIVSASGEWWIINYGGTYSDYPLDRRQSTLQILHIPSMEIIYSLNLPASYDMRGVRETDRVDFFYVGMNHPMTVQEWARHLFIDLAERKVYRASFSKEEYASWWDDRRPFYEQILSSSFEITDF